MEIFSNRKKDIVYEELVQRTSVNSTIIFLYLIRFEPDALYNK